MKLRPEASLLLGGFGSICSGVCLIPSLHPEFKWQALAMIGIGLGLIKIC